MLQWRRCGLEKQYYVYILTNKRKTTLYTGMTSNLDVRLWQHRNGTDPRSFSGRYKTILLVHVEAYAESGLASDRERQIKGWKRWRKIQLIELQNPGWEDLTHRWLGEDYGLA